MLLAYFVRRSITVQLDSCFIGLHSTEQVNLLIILMPAKLLESKWAKLEVSRTVILPFSKYMSILCLALMKVNAYAENTHRWGKHHYTAGLQFYKVALDCFTEYKKIILPSLVSSSLVKLETSRTVILPPTVSVLWPMHCAFQQRQIYFGRFRRKFCAHTKRSNLFHIRSHDQLECLDISIS